MKKSDFHTLLLPLSVSGLKLRIKKDHKYILLFDNGLREKNSINFAQSLCISHMGFMLSRHVQILCTGPLSGSRFKMLVSPLCHWLTFMPKTHFSTALYSLTPSP